MAFRLAADEYGKSEIRLLHVDRCDDRHEIRDLCVSVALAGEFTAAHVAGDNAAVVPTDTQKNTVFAFAAGGVGTIEELALRLARHFVAAHEPVTQARVIIEEYGWDRVGPHSFRKGSEARTVAVSHSAERTDVVSGIAGLTLLNTTGSEFTGFAIDRYTTLQPASDRILSTSVTARWATAGEGIDWAAIHHEVRQCLIEAFAQTYSYSLQHTLYAMASRVLEQQPAIAWVRLSLPNRHHDLVDLSPVGIANDGAVYAVPDRPYGLIRATVTRGGVAGGVAGEASQPMVHGA